MIVYVNTSNKGTLNLRQEPNGKVIAQIPYGTKLEAERVDEKWMKTGYNGKIGYVMTSFLKNDSPSTITKSDLQKVYNSLSETLKLIEKILK